MLMLAKTVSIDTFSPVIIIPAEKMIPVAPEAPFCLWT